MKYFYIKLRVVMVTILLTFSLLAMGEDPIKVFDLNIDNVYNMYIDNPGSAEGEEIICFQTTNQLIKTNSKGQIVETISNPHQYYIVFNGDTLILEGHTVVNSKGDIIVDYPEINGFYQYIAVSSLGIYVFQNVNTGASSVQNLLTGKKACGANNLKGLCCSKGMLYGIGKQSSESFPSILTWGKEEDENSFYMMPLTIKEPRGIAENMDYLYIYSDAQKALYRIESPLPQNQTVTSGSADSLNIGSDTIYYYERNKNYSDQLSAVISNNSVDSVVLYSLTTDLYINKNELASKRDIENLVKQFLPDACFKWDSGQYDYRCKITTGSPGLDDAYNALIDEDAITFVSKGYIRKDQKDLLDLYPFAGEIQACGIANLIQVTYLDDSTREKADELIKSIGLDIYSIDSSRTDMHKKAYWLVPKSIDAAMAANRLYESGLFLYAGPSITGGCVKKCKIETINHTDIPFYYSEINGSKQYMYKVPVGFSVRKSQEAGYLQIESLIRQSCGGYYRITWLSDNYCIVKTYSELVKPAIEALKKVDDIKWVSELYLDNEYYTHCLRYLEKMSYWGLDGKLNMVFKDIVTDDVKKRIIDDYRLSFVSLDTIQGKAKWIYETEKTEDVILICRDIYEKGYVEYAIPNIIKERDVKLVFNHTNSTTKIQETVPDIKEIETQYYDLLGRRINTPSGLTIIVTRYSDGSVRTEKRLFR